MQRRASPPGHPRGVRLNIAHHKRERAMIMRPFNRSSKNGRSPTEFFRSHPLGSRLPLFYPARLRHHINNDHRPSSPEAGTTLSVADRSSDCSHPSHLQDPHVRAKSTRPRNPPRRKIAPRNTNRSLSTQPDSIPNRIAISSPALRLRRGTPRPGRTSPKRKTRRSRNKKVNPNLASRLLESMKNIING